MKNYTDIDQSKELGKILPIVSADMWYSHYGHPGYNPVIAYNGEQWFLCQIRNSYHDDIPCWSLAALLNILPKEYAIPETFSDYENGIQNPFYGIVSFKAFTCFYSK